MLVSATCRASTLYAMLLLMMTVRLRATVGSAGMLRQGSLWVVRCSRRVLESLKVMMLLLTLKPVRSAGRMPFI